MIVRPSASANRNRCALCFDPEAHAAAPRRRDSPIVQGGRDGSQGDRTLTPDSPKNRKQGLGMPVGGDCQRLSPEPPNLTEIDRIAKLAAARFSDRQGGFVRSEISRRSFSASAA